MWRRLAPGLLLAGAISAALAADRSPAFAAVLPAVVGDVSGWEVVSGSFETDSARGSYVFYVNPERAALYQLMRYRVDLRTPASPLERARGAAERVAFIARPGVREPMLCWERVEGDVPSWRAVPAGTGPYLLEMNVLMRVLAAHRIARLTTPAP
jgi:hypothetical protein